MGLSSAAVTARALQCGRPTATLSIFLLSDIQTFFRGSWKWKPQVCPDRGPCVFPLSRRLLCPIRCPLWGNKRRTGGRKRRREKKKYRRLNINIIEGFWEAFLSHVDGIALLNGSQLLFLLLRSHSHSAFSSVSVSLNSVRPHHLRTSLNLSGILTIRNAAAVCRGLWERTVEIWFAHWWCGGAQASSLFGLLKNTHTHTHTHALAHVHVLASGVCNRQMEFFNSSISIFSPPPFPPLFFPSLPRSWKKGFKMSDGCSLRAAQALWGKPKKGQADCAGRKCTSGALLTWLTSLICDKFSFL